jgi:hypothetical protein
MMTRLILSDKPEEQVQNEENEQLDEVITNEDVCRSRYFDCGFIYKKETDESLIIFIARNLNSTIRIFDPLENGVYII